MMEKRNKIIYWIATVWLSLGMVSTGIVQLVKMREEVDKMTQLGYPGYFLPLIGIWKMLGVIAILMPKFALVKEWAYAGFFFTMTGALYSHVASGSAAGELFGPGLLLVLTIVSWYFRPAGRKISTANQ
jgi:hypothetical protein